MRTLAASLAALTLLAAAPGCGEREPCRRLAERDCARHGENSTICRDARHLADTADPYLIEVCRKELEQGR
ncbi:MAG: hypothetical protein JXB32_22855 [Deltaproteobacteria bacterium]|nr:hypothetical protein [Deltaproteobacteria bacterium]